MRNSEYAGLSSSKYSKLRNHKLGNRVTHCLFSSEFYQVLFLKSEIE